MGDELFILNSLSGADCFVVVVIPLLSSFEMDVGNSSSTVLATLRIEREDIMPWETNFEI